MLRKTITAVVIATATLAVAACNQGAQDQASSSPTRQRTSSAPTAVTPAERRAAAAAAAQQKDARLMAVTPLRRADLPVEASQYATARYIASANRLNAAVYAKPGWHMTGTTSTKSWIVKSYSEETWTMTALVCRDQKNVALVDGSGRLVPGLTTPDGKPITGPQTNTYQREQTWTSTDRGATWLLDSARATGVASC